MPPINGIGGAGNSANLLSDIFKSTGTSGGGNSSGGGKEKLLVGFVQMAANSKDEQTAKAAKSVLGGLGLDTKA